MLVLELEWNQVIQIGENVFLRRTYKPTKVGIEAPKEVNIKRISVEEYEKIKKGLEKK